MPSQSSKSLDGGRIDPVKALLLRKRGMSNADIARFMRVSRQAVFDFFHRVNDAILTDEQLASYEDVSGAMWKAVELKAMRMSLDDSRMKKASAPSLLLMAAQARTKVRETEGKSKGNAFQGLMVKYQRDGLELTMKAISGPVDVISVIENGVAEVEDTQTTHNEEQEKR